MSQLSSYSRSSSSPHQGHTRSLVSSLAPRRSRARRNHALAGQPIRSPFPARKPFKLTIQDLGSVGELIAALATLVTLVYLATQVKQAKREFHDSSQRARAEFTVGMGERAAAQQLNWFSPDGPNKTMVKALLTDERLSREEAFEFAVQMSILIGGLVQSETLYRQGLLDSEFLQTTRRSIYRPYLQMPRVRKWWARTGKQFYAHSGAVDLINRMVEEIEADEDSRSAIDTPGDR